jgi:hypothetical protein
MGHLNNWESADSPYGMAREGPKKDPSRGERRYLYENYGGHDAATAVPYVRALDDARTQPARNYQAAWQRRDWLRTRIGQRENGWPDDILVTEEVVAALEVECERLHQVLAAGNAAWFAAVEAEKAKLMAAWDEANP